MGATSSTVGEHEDEQPTITAEQQQTQDETLAEVTDRHSLAVVHHAVEAGDETAVQRLLAEGASVNEPDGLGRTPLMAAASVGAVQICALLADAGADVGAQDDFGQTALHIAVEGGASVELVQLLLQWGASPHVQDIADSTALHCALLSCNVEAAEVLVPTVGPALQRDDNGRTELHCAAAHGTQDMVRQLIGRASGGGSDRDNMGMTPLAQALQARNRETAEFLVMEACPCEADGSADTFGRTVLHWAAYAGYPEVVHQLMRRGFSPWVLDLCDRDALHWAVVSGERQVVKEILRDDGYRESVDNKGQTALHLAAIMGDAAVAALLLDRGANVARTDSKGRIPLMYALGGGYRETALLLATWGPVMVRRTDHKRRTLLHWAAMGGDVDCVRDLLVRGAPINAVDAQRKTPAALAVEHGHEAAATLLVETKGFRVTHDREGRTPLHGAASAGWSRLAMQLLARGANPYDGGCDNLSPVALAKRNGHYALAKSIARFRWRSE